MSNFVKKVIIIKINFILMSLLLLTDLTYTYYPYRLIIIIFSSY